MVVPHIEDVADLLRELLEYHNIPVASLEVVGGQRIVIELTGED